MSYYIIIVEAALLVFNAICVLHEERFLAKFGWSAQHNRFNCITVFFFYKTLNDHHRPPSYSADCIYTTLNVHR